VEPFDKFPMLTLEQLQEARGRGELAGLLLAVDAGLPGWPRVDLDSAQQHKFKHGQHFMVSNAASITGMVRVYGFEGDLLGLAEIVSSGNLQPSRVFNL
jgi:tRNA pseudouridine55 synthase